MNCIIREKIKISFIVPIYNVEKYIRQCIRSIMEQTYDNIEIILVDDGSPDKSGEIVDALAKEDGRIKVIHKQNGGVSSARNAGLKVAEGKYILFIDGDDYIEREYAEYFYDLMNDSGADMASDMNCFTIFSDDQIANDDREVWDNMKTMEAIYLGRLDVAVWNKIYKKDIIDKYGISFCPDIWYGEGMLFNIEYLQHTKCIAVGKRKVYHQVYNPDSAVRKFDLDSQFCGLRSLDVQRSVWKTATRQLERAWEYHRWNYAGSIIRGLIKTNMVRDYRDLYNQCKKEMRRNISKPWKADISFMHKVKLTIFSMFPYIVSVYGQYKFNALRKIQTQNAGGGYEKRQIQFNLTEKNDMYLLIASS